MENARLDQAKARTKKLKIGQTLPEVEELLGEPHEKVLGDSGINYQQQLWIYFVKGGTLQLSFLDYKLFKIEEI